MWQSNDADVCNISEEFTTMPATDVQVPATTRLFTRPLHFDGFSFDEASLDVECP